MKNKKYILLFAKLISYIKAKEQNPSQDEMDKVWNNILINIKKTDDKVEPCLKNIFENLIFKVLGAAAVVTVLIFSFNIYVDYPQNNSLKSYVVPSSNEILYVLYVLLEPSSSHLLVINIIDKVLLFI